MNAHKNDAGNVIECSPEAICDCDPFCGCECYADKAPLPCDCYDCLSNEAARQPWTCKAHGLTMSSYHLQCPDCVDDQAAYSEPEDAEDYMAYEDDGQPDEAQEWHDFDPDC